jgi:NAD+ diphosphatase
MSQVIVGIISQKTDDQIKYLLVSATKDWGKFTGSYYPPGGHIEEGEDKITALKREIKEELNLEIEPIKEVAETKGDVEGQITYWWSCKVIGGKMEIDKEEIKDAGFFSQEEMNNLKLWPATAKFFNNYIFNK